MARSSRTKDAARRASFGRAERLQRQAEAQGQTKAAPRAQAKARPDPAPQTAREQSPASTRPVPQRHRLTPLHRAQERQDRADAAAERGKLHRLQERTRADFNREADRRRDLTRRADYEVKQEARQKIIRRAEQVQRQTMQRQQDRRREETRRAFNREADRRRDQARRVEFARKQAEQQLRQKELDRRAVAELERDRKTRTVEQRDTHRRMKTGLESRHRVERDGFRDVAEITERRHHHALGNSYDRQDRELAEFDGRRKGLVGRVAELVPGRSAEMDRQRDQIVRRHDTERKGMIRDYEGLKERQFTLEQDRRIEHMKERKALADLIRDDRTRLDRDHAHDRPRQIEERGRSIERADRAQEQQREQEREGPPRENVRPSGDFARAAPKNREAPPNDSREAPISHKPAADRHEAFCEAAVIPVERELERA